jgi:hypothetical protein
MCTEKSMQNAKDVTSKICVPLSEVMFPPLACFLRFNFPLGNPHYTFQTMATCLVLREAAWRLCIYVNIELAQKNGGACPETRSVRPHGNNLAVMASSQEHGTANGGCNFIVLSIRLSNYFQTLTQVSAYTSRCIKTM